MAKKSLKDLLKKKIRATELEAGVHENVYLVSMDIKDRKDHTGNKIKKQMFLMFKQVDGKGEIVGQREISFFIVDPIKEYALDNLIEFIKQTKEILSPYMAEDEIKKKFNPAKVLYDKGEKQTDTNEKEFEYDNIKNSRLKKLSNYAKVEDAVKKQAMKLIGKQLGFDSVPLRFKLVEDKNKYVQIPRFGAFIEPMEITRKDSLILKSNV